MLHSSPESGRVAGRVAHEQLRGGDGADAWAAPLEFLGPDGIRLFSPSAGA